MRIQPVIKEALHLIRSTIPTTIDIKQDIHPDCDPVNQILHRFIRLLLNLATNAYPCHGRERGCIKRRVETRGVWEI